MSSSRRYSGTRYLDLPKYTELRRMRLHIGQLRQRALLRRRRRWYIPEMLLLLLHVAEEIICRMLCNDIHGQSPALYCSCASPCLACLRPEGTTYSTIICIIRLSRNNKFEVYVMNLSGMCEILVMFNPEVPKSGVRCDVSFG